MSIQVYSWEERYFPILLLALYVIIIISTTATFFSLRNAPSISLRSVPLTLILTASNSIIVCNICLRHILDDYVPCLIFYWIKCLAYAIFTLTLTARTVQFSFQVRAKQAAVAAVRQGNGGLSGKLFGRRKTLLEEMQNLGDRLKNVDDKSEDVDFHTIDTPTSTVMNMEKKPSIHRNSITNNGSQAKNMFDELHINKEEDVGHWYLKNRRRLSDKLLIYYISVVLIAFSLILVSVQLISPELKNVSASAHCALTWENIPALALIVVTLCINVPLLFSNISDINDTYGIKYELCAVYTLGTLGISSHLLYQFFNQGKRVPFPLYFVLIFLLVVVHSLMVLRPIWWYVKEQWIIRNFLKENNDLEADSASQMREIYGLILSDNILFEDFKEYTIKDFSVENALFYEIATRLAQNPPSDASYLIEQQKAIYDLFISPTADIPLNVTSQSVQKIRCQVAKNEFKEDMFNDVLREVMDLMYTDTFLRFWKSKTEKYKLDLSRRVERRKRLHM